MTKRKDNSQVGAGSPRPTSGSLTRPASIPSFQTRVDMVVKDYERMFKGNALKQRISDDNSELIIVFEDGRKFHFPFPPAWLKDPNVNRLTGGNP